MLEGIDVSVMMVELMVVCLMLGMLLRVGRLVLCIGI